MKNNLKKFSLLAAVFNLLSLSGAYPASLINGAGATFPYPLYSKWFSEFKKVDPSTEINYQSIGSGGGIKQFLDRTIDFGATDAPMKDEDIGKAQNGVLHIPTALGAVVLTHNVPGVKEIKMSPEVAAEIFLGKITKWDDEKLKKLNPKTALPSTAIIVVRRSDGSGTTNIFTDYLSKVSAEWKQKVGAGTAVSWPAGLGAKGNEGVTGLIKQTPGSLGYVELIYAANNHLQVVSLQNKAGMFVNPDLKSVTAAAAGALKAMPEDFRVSITNSDGKDAYPISGFTYLLISQKMEKEKGSKILGFLKWALKDGQKMAKDLNYAPLPGSLIPKIEAKLKTVSLN